MMRCCAPHRHSGFTLVEVMVALVIFSFGLLGLVGLQGTMIKNATDAKYRSDAADLADQIIGTMWADQSNVSQYAYNSSSPAPTCSTTTPSYATSCSGLSPACNVANWICEVNSSLHGSLAGQTIQIANGPNANSQQVTVTVQWPGSGTATHEFTETTDIGG
ncbi:MAG: type IV pilus modification protein PilV [Betaproteobacteria bacterium]|nr:type IV pilus modification protein PilV [Betaproteobacteria bacterium]